MAKDAFPFRIGEFDCLSLNDGYHDYKIEGLFANVDRHEVEQALRAGDWPTDRITTPYMSLYVDTSEHHVLVDTGAGDFFTTTGRLQANLRKAGIDPAEIDTVVITHAHADHIGGLLNQDGTPTYPNARVYTMEAEWEYWLAEDALEKAPGFKQSIALAHRVFHTIGDRFRFIQPDTELLPGIRLLAAFGHTPGHFAVEASSSGESVIYISDAILHPLQVEHPDWLPDPRYVFDFEEFQATARRLLRQAVATNALVLGMHFLPLPSLGHIVEKGEGLRWQPLQIS